MTGRIFVDSNVWVYLFLQDETSKFLIAESFIEEETTNSTLVISWQVINEVSHVLKKHHFEESIIREIVENMCQLCVIQDFSVETALSASLLREKYSLSFWDSHIVAAALAADCDCLVSEDMQNNQRINHLSIKNIFRE
jgi:predicted nucleic acid-binding protein